MNMKFSIGIVVAIVLQVSAFVWWTAQQAQTIDLLKGEVAELTAKSEIEKEVTLLNDVKQLQKDIEELNQKTLDAILETHNRIDDLGGYVDSQDQLINDTFTVQMKSLHDFQHEFEVKVANSFTQIEEWLDEIELDAEEALNELDKKLSDRIEDHSHND
jgi:Tfp pilus assembly protein PilN